MKAAQIIKYGGTDAIVFNVTTPSPKVVEGKVVIEVHTAGLNPFDWKVRAGFMQQTIPLQFPTILGGDFSGIISEVGTGVSDFIKGQEVFGQASIFNGGSGSLAEYVLADIKAIASKPKNINHVQAAALPLAGVSVLQVLTEHIKLVSGQKILIHGGAGGIGSLAIQVAKHLGAYVATTVGVDDVQFVEMLGADEVVDYKNQTFENVLQNFDAVFDTIGGETYEKSFKVLKKDGLIVSMLEQPKTELMEQYGVRAIAQQTRVTTERLVKLSELVDLGVIKIQIDKIFPLEQVGEALTYLQESHSRGKVVITVK